MDKKRRGRPQVSLILHTDEIVHVKVINGLGHTVLMPYIVKGCIGRKRDNKVLVLFAADAVVEGGQPS